MSLAQFRKHHSHSGAGRLVVSEGVAPSCYLLPSEDLLTLFVDHEDDRFEIVIPQGTILSVVARDDEDHPKDGYVPVRVVPANTTSTPIGVAQYHLHRPFDKGTSQGAGFITHGYLEYPMIYGLNDDVVPGDVIVADALGRPVVGAADADARLIVGKVIEVEPYGKDFDYGLLQYMELPSDPGALGDLFPNGTRAGTSVEDRASVRANLLQAFEASAAREDSPVVGAFRVNLTL